MASRFFYLRNVFMEWLYRHGYEQPVGPEGPFVDPDPTPWRMGPQPDPWKERAGHPVARTAVRELAKAAQAKELAAHLPDGPLKQALTRSASSAISQILDDTCGTPPRAFPWPWPGPPPWVWEIASELSSHANSLRAGALRDSLLEIAGNALTHSEERTKY